MGRTMVDAFNKPHGTKTRLVVTSLATVGREAYREEWCT